MYGFVECDICRVKPGTPALCPACLMNRQIICDQHNQIERLQAIVDKPPKRQGRSDDET